MEDRSKNKGKSSPKPQSTIKPSSDNPLKQVVTPKPVTEIRHDGMEYDKSKKIP